MATLSKKAVYTLIGIVLLLPIIYLILLQYDNIVALFHSSEMGSNDENGVQNWDWNFMEKMEKQYQKQYQSYFVHTKGCKMPSFPVNGKNIDKFVFKETPIDCGKPLIRSNDSYLWIDLNETEIKTEYGVKHIEDLECEYNSMKRITDFKSEYDKFVHIFKFGDVVKINDEYIHVTCKQKSTDNQIYRDYHFFITGKHKEATKSDELNSFFHSLQKDKSHSNGNQTTNKPMSVLILGLDSISRLNFHRQMQESASVLLNDLKAIELFGFNKVEDNTYPNTIAFLASANESEMLHGCRDGQNNTYDRCNFIWKDFKEKNYVTAFAEDVAEVGVFHYLQPGFTNQSTDYNLRPIIVEMEKNIVTERLNPWRPICMEKRRTYDILMEYAQKFINAMADRLYFGLFWSVTYTHDKLNLPQIIDADFANFLRQMKSSNKLDNTFLIVMSDHGLRFGEFRSTYQSMMEERQPFVYLVPPKRFAQQYPEAMRNLVRNRHALTTPFDVYEMLRDLANLEMIESPKIVERAKKLQDTEPLPRGISLFLPVPESRTCSMAEITDHWCTCKEHTILNKTDPRIIESAQTVLNHLNNLLQARPECVQPLKLNQIFGGSLGESLKDKQHRENSFQDIVVRLQTLPGPGNFEASVRFHNQKRFEVHGIVSRTNMYNNQSHCINDYKLRLYCFCKDLL